MYKLIALDMDGTLLNSKKVISQENKDAIAKARATGVKVVLASGRPLEGMQSKLDELSINGDDDFVLFYNGCMVQNVSTKELIHSEICMGDAENDHHMLNFAGLGIAMDNAMEETKKLADYITASNDDHGVAVAIEKFIFNS